MKSALEARRALDVDFDADEGALLVLPAAIQSCAAPESGLMDWVRRRASQLEDWARL